MTPPSPPLVGAVGAGLEVVYVSDVGSDKMRPRLDAKAASALFARLAETTGNAGLRPDLSSPSSSKTLLRLANGGFVPLKGHANSNGIDDHRYLDHLNALVRVRPDPDERSRLADARASRADRAWELRSRVVRKIRADVDLTAEVEALRSSLHPLPLEGRRAEVRRIVLGLGVKADSDLVVEATVDALLFDLHPWSLRRDTRVDDGGGASLVLTDFEVASGALELAMAVVGPGAVVGQAIPSAADAFGEAPQEQQQQQQQQEAPQEQQEQQEHGEDDAWNSNLGNKKRRNRDGRRLLPMPLDEPTLARAVSHAQVQAQRQQGHADTFSSSEPSNPSSHRSRAYLAQQPSLVPRADAYLALHLAHRELRSDAPASLQDAVRFVQDAVLSVDVALIRDGTLGRMVQQKKHKQDRAVRGSPWGLRADLADAIARRRTWSSSASSYVTSTFELEALSRFLGVEVVVVRAPASNNNKKKSARMFRKSASTNRWLLEAAEARIGSNAEGRTRSDAAKARTSRKNATPFVMLVLREDGLGHDLALAPAPEAGAVREAGHTILW
jgi:hypothetical protein